VEISNDGAAWTEVERVVMPIAGTFMLSLSGRPIRVTTGQYYRVRGIQSGAIGDMSAALRGYTASDDVEDI
jgi:hypothetical protein